MGETSLLFQSSIAKSIHNLDSSRTRHTSLETRKEGWTEVWGTADDTEHSKEATWKEEQESIAIQFATRHPQLPLVLVQHRPAWLEQLVLKIAGIPYIVVNSPYVATESTGPLPYLRDFQPHKPPVLVGRHHPGDSSNQNSILAYLSAEHKVSLEPPTGFTPEQKAQAHLVSTLLETHLNPIVKYLQYQDEDAWEQVYRPQYVQAASSGTYSNRRQQRWYRPRPFDWFQAWSVRVVATQTSARHFKSVDEACAAAKESYTSLETLLKKQTYFFTTDQPTLTDALVFAHLAEALCDVHLVVVLADYPKLVKFFQTIYERYFSSSLLQDEEWVRWNVQENWRNPFQQLPLEEHALARSMSSGNDPPFHNALQLMQSLSVHTHDLQEVLTLTKEQRQAQARQVKNEQSHPPPEASGSTLFRCKKEEPATAETPEAKQWRKDTKHNDELWLSAVLAGTILALVLGAQRSSSS